jgi:RimJ/RimL family protein N-acetyltransferase
MIEKWLKHPIVLNGKTVDLLPLEKDHLDYLFLVASDERLWEFIPTDCSDRAVFQKTYLEALEFRKKGSHYPFVIYHKATRRLIGSTRFFEIYPNDKKLEIGWTWIAFEFWGTSANIEAKLLMLTYCFEVLKTNRVQLKTDETNIRSRKAIEKIGGKFEGIFRKDKIKANGIPRNAAYYSILDDEWQGVKKGLIELLETYATV